MKLSLILILVYCPSLICMEKMQDNLPFQITQEVVAEYKENGFREFVTQRTKDFQMGNSITSIPIIGSVVEWGLATIKGVDMEKARIFFARINDEENTFNAQLEQFEKDNQNIAYLESIFKRLTPAMIAAKSPADLSNAIEKSKDLFFTDAQTMYTKDENGQYIYDSKKFADYALCNLMAAHIINEYKQLSPRQRKRRNNKNNNIIKDPS